ncbi:MAG TPA: hydroxymethylbilane synthase [Syntrophorhabdaceae bacterium]|nr:hydroxymethylbilane synthase [Syntrophorhabdaceae bacterium]HQM80419.1 hydroxymethylbilane synthase [Syntrophorhabdaceae bacterium]
MKKIWTIGTRGSKLALKQTEIVVRALSSLYPGMEFPVKTIKTKGDTIWDRPLHLIGGKGLFVKEIEDELLRGSIDMAVHSVKDLPSELEDGLILGAVLKREDPRDAFISLGYNRLEAVPPLSKIGTSSLRRKAQILRLKKEIEVIPLRGNVDTRIRKLKTQSLDGIILACAGVKRMGFTEHIREIIPVDIMVPSAGQGAIGIEVRYDNNEVIQLLSPVNDPVSAEEISIERELLGKIGGGCQIPLGIHANIKERSLTLYLSMGGENGRTFVHEKETYRREQAADAVREAHNKIKPFLA